jgi:hypothetical protein
MKWLSTWQNLILERLVLATLKAVAACVARLVRSFFETPCAIASSATETHHFQRL